MIKVYNLKELFFRIFVYGLHIIHLKNFHPLLDIPITSYSMIDLIFDSLNHEFLQFYFYKGIN